VFVRSKYSALLTNGMVRNGLRAEKGSETTSSNQKRKRKRSGGIASKKVNMTLLQKNLAGIRGKKRDKFPTALRATVRS